LCSKRHGRLGQPVAAGPCTHRSSVVAGFPEGNYSAHKQVAGCKFAHNELLVEHKSVAGLAWPEQWLEMMCLNVKRNTCSEQLVDTVHQSFVGSSPETDHCILEGEQAEEHSCTEHFDIPGKLPGMLLAGRTGHFDDQCIAHQIEDGQSMVLGFLGKRGNWELTLERKRVLADTHHNQSFAAWMDQSLRMERQHSGQLCNTVQRLHC